MVSARALDAVGVIVVEPIFFILSILISLILFGVAVVGFSRGWISVKSRTELEIEELRKQVKWLTAERNQLLSEIVELRRESKSQLAEMRASKEKLEQEVEQLRRRLQSVSDLVVLCIWPDSNLDISGERNAVRRSGLRYRALTGQNVTPAAILRELRHGDIGILEIGAHGDVERIVMNDLSLDPGWWFRALQGRGVQVAVILSCFSDQSVGDAMLRAGVRHVIAANGELEDRAAIAFAEQFYSLYADGVPVREAYDDAILALGDHAQADRLVLR